jgi:hypothetical protein
VYGIEKTAFERGLFFHVKMIGGAESVYLTVEMPLRESFVSLFVQANDSIA